jgi:hypothetical protein
VIDFPQILCSREKIPNPESRIPNSNPAGRWSMAGKSPGARRTWFFLTILDCFLAFLFPPCLPHPTPLRENEGDADRGPLISPCRKQKCVCEQGSIVPRRQGWRRGVRYGAGEHRKCCREGAAQALGAVNEGAGDALEVLSSSPCPGTSPNRHVAYEARQPYTCSHMSMYDEYGLPSVSCSFPPFPFLLFLFLFLFLFLLSPFLFSLSPFLFLFLFLFLCFLFCFISVSSFFSVSSFSFFLSSLCDQRLPPTLTLNCLLPPSFSPNDQKLSFNPKT